MASSTTAKAYPKQSLNTDDPLPRIPDDITLQWLQKTLGPSVKHAKVRKVLPGTATKVFVDLSYHDSDEANGVEETKNLARPSTICVKGGFNPDLFEYGVQKAYSREADFFARLAPELDIRRPNVWYATTNPSQGQGILFLDDLVALNCSFGECTEPFTVQQVASGLEQLAKLHGATWNATPAQYPWLESADALRDVCLALLEPNVFDSCLKNKDMIAIPEEYQDRERISNGYHLMWKNPSAQCVLHGDAHISNTFLTPDNDVGWLDYQSVHIGHPMHDVSYFVAGALDIEDRRKHERDLLQHYVEALKVAGGPALKVDDIWDDYRRYHFHGFLWAFTPVEMQGKERVKAMGTRHLQAILDHETLVFLENSA